MIVKKCYLIIQGYLTWPSCFNLAACLSNWMCIFVCTIIKPIMYVIPVTEEDKKNIEKTCPDQEDKKDYHKLDEQVNICLECKEINTMKCLKRKILRLSSQATVTHLKKFVASKVLDSMDRYKDVSIFVVLLHFLYAYRRIGGLYYRNTCSGLVD